MSILSVTELLSVRNKQLYQLSDDSITLDTSIPDSDAITDVNYQSSLLEEECVMTLKTKYQEIEVITSVPSPVNSFSSGNPTNLRSILIGSNSNSLIIGDNFNNFINSRSGDDLVFGFGGNDILLGGRGSDHLIGDFLPADIDFDQYGQILKFEIDSRNDILKGGKGDDILVDQYGSDVLRGGKGNDRLISISDSGTPRENNRIPAQSSDGNDLEKLRFSQKFFNNEGLESNDILSGGLGADTFEWNLLINASKSIVEKNTTDGIINWGMDGVAGENTNYHDHWVDGIGRDVITDFSGSGGEGDKIIIKGHTVQAMLLFEMEEKAVIGLYSDQGNDGERGGGAHDFDVLGKIVVRHDGNFNYENDVSLIGVDYGAYGDGAYLADSFGFA